MNPNSRSEDHRGELTLAERIQAEERQRELVPLLRRIPADVEAATAALVSARRRAVDARVAACRARIAEKLQIFYRDLERVAAGSHADLATEVAAMNEVLRIPGAPPAFVNLICPEFLEGGILAERRRLLAADGWLATD